MIVYELPIPPSTNNLFPTGRRKGSSHYRYVGRGYREWRGDAGRMLLAQGPLKTIDGPVNIRLIVRDAGNGDLDNKAKAVLDFLVHHGIIKDDNRAIVRKILLEWGPVDGARVEITQAVMV